MTLEPCTHFGRTPPCVEALLPLRLRRVVVAMTDPNPRVRGRGVRRLRAAGVPVTVGVGEAQARVLTAGYCTHVLHGLDAVAYVRFASVYRSFRDVHEFMRELEDLIAERRVAPRRRPGKTRRRRA